MLSAFFIGVRQVVLETEFDNAAALSLYESLGFIREKRLYRFYLNGKDAFRLVLVVTPLSCPDEKNGESPVDRLKAHSLTTPRLPLLNPPIPIRFFPAIPYDSDDEVSSR